MPTTWVDPLLVMVRVLINDMSDTPTYSDERLTTLLVVAAQLAVGELDLNNTYEIDVAEETILPDPVEIKDVEFINFLALKAACLVDQSTFRSKALLEGIKAVAGPASLIVQGNLSGFRALLEMGPCKAYEDLRFSGTKAGLIRAVLSPFTSDDMLNQFGGNSNTQTDYYR